MGIKTRRHQQVHGSSSSIPAERRELLWTKDVGVQRNVAQPSGAADGEGAGWEGDWRTEKIAS